MFSYRISYFWITLTRVFSTNSQQGAGISYDDFSTYEAENWAEQFSLVISRTKWATETGQEYPTVGYRSRNERTKTAERTLSAPIGSDITRRTNREYPTGVEKFEIEFRGLFAGRRERRSIICEKNNAHLPLSSLLPTWKSNYSPSDSVTRLG